MIDEIYEIEMNGTTVIREKSKKERKKNAKRNWIRQICAAAIFASYRYLV
jgi:hypothetical protein